MKMPKYNVVPRSWIIMGEMKPWIVITSVLAAAQTVAFIYYCVQLIMWNSHVWLWRTMLLNVAVVLFWFVTSFRFSPKNEE